ncbi:MAG: carbohydrate ABC transporter substrate-binding protein [Clostridia bacterium]|nr:carbohydrate ABC transporter substrate-binding protein [Clostridia bacterium]
MKRILLAGMLILLCVVCSACGSKKPEAKEEAGFKPALDTKTSCEIKVAGTYANFEALEAEFDSFNRIYPNVVLSYVKLDDYNNIIGTALEGSDAPNIYFTFFWMYEKEQYEACLAHAEDLSDPKLGLELAAFRPGLLSRREAGRLDMLPVFSSTNGMLVNEDLFKKEGLTVPETYPELLQVCSEFQKKGYQSPVMCYLGEASQTSLISFGLPVFCGSIYQEEGAVEKLVRMEPGCGEYARPALERMHELIEKGYLNPEECGKIADSYNKVILRFFEGDVPMMICAGDVVSGTKKRESQSETFTAKPFTYSFIPVPADETGAYFIDTPNVEFSVNRDCANLDMTNEFMRFLMSAQELNKMAQIKRLPTVTTDLSFDSVYAPFGKIPESRIISEEGINLKDNVVVQLRKALYAVALEGISVDEAVRDFTTR